MHEPLAIDLFCGLGGWTEGLLAEGYDVIGFDVERHRYGDAQYPAQLVLQDVLTLHGSQFKDATLIVASPPCQGYSYRAMPWSRAKALPPPDNSLFEACFRIQSEACEAAGRHIPLIVENVRGAQKWVGRSRWNYGSFHLWGNVPALMPMAKSVKVGGVNWSEFGKPGYKAVAFNTTAEQRLRNDITSGCGQNPDGRKHDASGWLPNRTLASCNRMVQGGIKQGGSWFHDSQGKLRQHSSGSSARKAASAHIAKIPYPLARYIAAVFKPQRAAA